MDKNFFFPFAFQLLMAMFFQKFSVAAPEGKEVKDGTTPFVLLSIPQPFQVVVSKRF